MPNKRGIKLEYSYEIIEALFEYYNDKDRDDRQTLAKILRELYLSTGCYDFEKEVNSLCDKYNLCPVCLEGEVIDSCIGSQSLEYFGSPVEMSEYERVCVECGNVF